jgi:hypothetical protein
MKVLESRIFCIAQWYGWDWIYWLIVYIKMNLHKISLKE